MPFPYIEITDSSARCALAFCLGIAHIVLGVMQVVGGFQQVNQAAVSSGSKMTIDGAEEIYDVIRGQERNWQHLCKGMISILSLIVLDAVFQRLTK